jgi:hypothetical protein
MIKTFIKQCVYCGKNIECISTTKTTCFACKTAQRRNNNIKYKQQRVDKLKNLC